MLIQKITITLIRYRDRFSHNQNIVYACQLQMLLLGSVNYSKRVPLINMVIILGSMVVTAQSSVLISISKFRKKHLNM